MKHLRNKMAVGATLASLGGLTAVAMSQGTAKRRASTAAPVAADVRTVTETQTIHRYRHVGLGDGAHGSATRTAAVHVGWAKAAAVATRASGSHAAAVAGTTTGGGGAHVKSYASGAKGDHGTTRSDNAPGKSAPSTRASGAKPEKSGGGGKGSSPSAPTTKPSGASVPESSGGSTPGTPPTTKPSGASGGSGGSGTGTETTPTSPPTTKPSGVAGGGTETGEGGKTEGHEGHEHDD